MPTIGKIFYAERGQGEALLCLHGAGGNHTHWGRIMAGLADIARVVTIDLPGHGRSAPPACPTIAAYGAAALDLLTALDLERAILVGHSLGAAAALEAALIAPERVAGLILVGAAARLRVAPATLSGLVERPVEAVEQLVAAIYPPPAAALRPTAIAEYLQDPALLRADLLACDGWDIRARLETGRIATLLISGELDVLTPPRLANELRDLLGAELISLPAAGHAPMLDAPVPTLLAMRAWLTARRTR